MNSNTIATSVQPPEPMDKILCGICHRQFSKYTCPSCNLAYCSLLCFRSEKHASCSETFYRKQVESDINTEPSRTTEERMKMVELLQRFEQENTEDITSLDEEAEDEDDLVRRLEGVDLATASQETIWSLLTPSERDRFMKMTDDPLGESAKDILESGDLKNELHEPWWETSSSATDDDLSRTSHLPPPISIPSDLSTGPSQTTSFYYNFCSICLAYCYIVRHFSVSSISALSRDEQDCRESAQLLSRLVPFLTAKKATTLHRSLTSAINDLWSRFDLDTMQQSTLSLLLNDVALILQPARIAEVPTKTESLTDVTSHPNIRALRVLGDLTHLFTAKHILYKLSFYGGHIAAIPPSALSMLATEVQLRARAEAAPRSEVSANLSNRQPPPSIGIEPRKAMIEEIS